MSVLTVLVFLQIWVLNDDSSFLWFGVVGSDTCGGSDRSGRPGGQSPGPGQPQLQHHRDEQGLNLHAEVRPSSGAGGDLLRRNLVNKTTS